LNRADRIAREVSARRDQFHLEAAWPAVTRLVYDFFGVRFDDPMPELELGFWKASVETRPMPGACEALEHFSRSGLAMAVLSNSGFGEHVIRYELDRHGLASRLAFIMASAEYAVRKPEVLLIEAAAARLGFEPKAIWFVGDRLDTDVAGAKAAGMTAVWFRPAAARDLPSGDADFMTTGWTTWKSGITYPRWITWRAAFFAAAHALGLVTAVAGALGPADLDALDGADVLVVQLEIPVGTVRQAALAARDRDVPVILNAAPVRPLPDDLLDAVDLLVVNEHEAAALAGTGHDQPDEAARRLRRHGERGGLARLAPEAGRARLPVGA